MKGLVRAAFAVVLLLAACSDDPAPASNATPPAAVQAVDAAGIWVLRSGHGPGGRIAIPRGTRVTMQIDGDTIRGHTGCNAYGGGVTISGDSFETGGFALSEIGCAPDLAELEQLYVEAVGDADTVARDGRTLTLTGPATELVFRRVPPVDPRPLTGTVWRLESLVEGPSPSSGVASARPARLLLRADGTFEGTTGCRSFSGTWEVTGDVVSVTQMVFEGNCRGGGEQDSHVASALGAGFRAERDGDRLVVTAESGGLGLVYRSK
ncbi:MAG TPA: META domain-containing protein [Actinomycetota bacterium]|nr:META domain-containing protein [Actinomycetota bacterium]